MAVNWNDAAIRQRAQQAAMRGLIRATEGVRNEAISLILNTRKSGRVYRRHGVFHQASAPGEPFASDTGRAVGSIRTQYDFQTLTGTVVVSDPKFPYLEFGTQKMEPRPVLRPALANKSKDVVRFVAEEISKEFSR